MKLEDSIIQQLPQIPYVIDQVGEALAWAKETLDEGEYNRTLTLTYDVLEFTKSVSDPNFFKTHYVIATILSNINKVKEDERFAKFDSASKAVEKTLDKIIIEPESIEKYGCFKAIMLHLIPLAKKDIEVFTIALIGIKHALSDILKGYKETKVNSPITGNDYITILGYALVIANIRMANLHMTNYAYNVYNEISVILNNELNY